MVRTLTDYMNYSACLPLNSGTVELGLKLALKHSLGVRDTLILASYSPSKQVKTFVTMDESILYVREVLIGKKIAKVTRLSDGN